MIRKFDSSGAVVCWDSARCSRVPVEAAFTAIGHGNLIPKVNKLAAVHEAARAVAHVSGFCAEGLPTLKRFTLDRSRVGVGVYQEIRGADENEYRFLFSVGVAADTGEAEVLKTAPGIGHPIVGPHQTANDRYQEATEYLQASDFTKAVNSLIGKSHGVGIRDNGSFYFVPGEFISTSTTLSDALERLPATGRPKLHCWQVDLAANPKLAETVNDSMIGDIIGRMEKRAADWQALKDHDGKPQKRGLETRFEEMLEDAQQIEYYERFFAVRHDKLREALEAQQAMIGMAHLDLWNAGEQAA